MLYKPKILKCRVGNLQNQHDSSKQIVANCWQQRGWHKMCIATPPMPSSANCEQPQSPDRISGQERERCHLAGNYRARCSRAIRLPIAISGSAMCKSCYLGSATCAARRSSRTTGDRSTLASWVAPCGQNVDCCFYLFHAQDNGAWAQWILKLSTWFRDFSTSSTCLLAHDHCYRTCLDCLIFLLGQSNGEASDKCFCWYVQLWLFMSMWVARRSGPLATGLHNFDTLRNSCRKASSTAGHWHAP